MYSPNLNPHTERPGKRRSIRLKGYDYTRVGGYFITICTRNRDLLFREIVKGEMVLNTIGNIIDFHWRRLPQHFKHIKLVVNDL